MTKPIELAMEWCREHDEDFRSELDLHLETGWVYSGDDAFVMATEEASEDLLTLSLNKDVDIDTWYVYLYSGSLKRVLELIPTDKRNKFVAFRRDNGTIKIYETDRLLARIRGL
jgi:hypothetical protein